MCRPSQTPHLTMSSARVGPRRSLILERGLLRPARAHRIRRKTMEVVVFHRRLRSHLSYTLHVFSQCQTRVKLNRVFFPRRLRQARSLGCAFPAWRLGTVGIWLT